MTLQDDSTPSILLIGSGRLALHLKHWNTLLARPNQLILWDRSQDLGTLQKYILQAHLVWLAIADSNIVSFYEKHFLSSKIKVVHFSGALYDSRLHSAHPMMSFPHSLLPHAIYAKIGFAVQGAKQLNELMPGFNNEYFLISAADKPFYHALCVVAGNFPQLLWNEVATCLPDLAIPEATFHTYISQVLNNFLTLKEKSLTGPMVRKDEMTMQKNINALVQHPKLQHIYRAFQKEFRQ